MVTVTMLMPSCFAQAPSSPICPSSIFIFPCSCKSYRPHGIPLFDNTISIDCGKKNLGDFQMSNVLNAFLVPGLSPVNEISAPLNQLTKVPNEISKFPNLLVINLSSNRITEIPPGVFNFTSEQSIQILLTNNNIYTVHSDAFRLPKAVGVEIILNRNQISSLPDGVFFIPFCKLCYYYVGK